MVDMTCSPCVRACSDPTTRICDNEREWILIVAGVVARSLQKRNALPIAGHEKNLYETTPAEYVGFQYTA
jgi:hypothetical protein